MPWYQYTTSNLPSETMHQRHKGCTYCSILERDEKTHSTGMPSFVETRFLLFSICCCYYSRSVYASVSLIFSDFEMKGMVHIKEDEDGKIA